RDRGREQERRQDPGRPRSSRVELVLEGPQRGKDHRQLQGVRGPGHGQDGQGQVVVLAHGRGCHHEYIRSSIHQASSISTRSAATSQRVTTELRTVSFASTSYENSRS